MTTLGTEPPAPGVNPWFLPREIAIFFSRKLKHLSWSEPVRNKIGAFTFIHFPYQKFLFIFTNSSEHWNSAWDSLGVPDSNFILFQLFLNHPSLKLTRPHFQPAPSVTVPFLESQWTHIRAVFSHKLPLTKSEYLEAQYIPSSKVLLFTDNEGWTRWSESPNCRNKTSGGRWG